MFENLPLSTLKRIAKTRRIKMYYTMKKDDLQALLELPELPIERVREKLTLKELREIALERNIVYTGLSKGELFAILFTLEEQPIEKLKAE